MKVKIKKLREDAVIPSYAKEGDAGLDLTAVDIYTETKQEIEEFEFDGKMHRRVHETNVLVAKTGLAIEIPFGYVGLLFPRSSISNKELSLKNSVGVIDPGYRGEVTLKFREFDNKKMTYNVGDRVGQLIIFPFPKIELVVTDSLSETERGTGGYGSSGN